MMKINKIFLLCVLVFSAMFLQFGYSQTVSAFSCGTSQFITSNSGIDTTILPSTLDSVAISGLTATDMLVVYYNLNSVDNDVGTIELYNSTDTVKISEVSFNTLYAGTAESGIINISQLQSSNKDIKVLNLAGGDNFNGGRRLQSVFSTPWTGSWILALNNTGGISIGGSLHWNWSVYKIGAENTCPSGGSSSSTTTTILQLNDNTQQNLFYGFFLFFLSASLLVAYFNSKFKNK